jgi:hypothetical protein
MYDNHLRLNMFLVLHSSVWCARDTGSPYRHHASQVIGSMFVKWEFVLQGQPLISAS